MKKISSKIAIGIILPIVILIGVIFWMQSKKENSFQQPTIIQPKNQKDINQNGVRDDVDALIDSKSYTANQKTALKTYANRLEKFISATDDDAINAAADEMTAALRTTYYSEFGADEDPLIEIKDKELDTKEKMKIYLQSLDKLNGKVD